MIDPRFKEQEYCNELSLMINEAYKDPEIDPDHMLGFLLAVLEFSKTIDRDRVDHFHKIGLRKLSGGDVYETN